MLLVILLTSLICCIIYVLNVEISTREFLLTILAIFLSVGIVYGVSLIPFHNDKYFESGRLIQTQYYPYFVEQYQQAHTVTVSNGKTTTTYTYYTTEYAKHQPHWEVKDSLGKEWGVSKKFHNKIKNDFGNKCKITKPYKCTHGGHVHKGDPYVYNYDNNTNTYKYPTNHIKTWHNPIKGKSSLFNNKVDLNIKYPKHISVYKTNRKLAKTDITDKEWEILNTKIYEKVKANLILVEMKDSKEFSKLEDLWLNGKFNDLVICFVGDYKNPTNVKVFGWSDSSLVKVKLEQHILENGIQQSSLEELQQIIIKNYKPYDLSKFNYLTNPPSLLTIIIALIVSLVVGGICIHVFSCNAEDKNYKDDDFWNFYGGYS